MTEPSPSRHALAKAKVLQHCESDYFVPCETGSAFDGLVIASSMPGFDELIDHTYRLGYIRLVANVKVAYFNIIRLAPAKRGREESAFWEYPKIKEGPQRYHAAFYVLLPDTNVDVVGLIPAELYFMLFEGREEPQDMNDPIPTSLTPYMMQINRLGAALDRVRDAALKISAFMVPGSEMALRGWNVRVREVDLADQVAEDNDDTEDLEADHAEDASGQMQPTNATATDKQHSGLFTTFSPSDTAIQLQDICAHNRDGLILPLGPYGAGNFIFMKYTWTAGESLTWLDSRHLPRHFFNVEEDFSSAGGINLLITPYRHYSSPTLQLSTPGGESQSEWCRIGHQLCGIDYLQRPLPYLLIGYLVEDPKPERPLFILPSGVLTLPSGLEEEAAPSESQVVLQQHVEEPVKVTDAMVNAEELVEKLNKLGSHDVEFAKGACRIRKETMTAKIEGRQTVSAESHGTGSGHVKAKAVKEIEKEGTIM